MALIDTIIRVQGRGNDLKRKILLDKGVRCFLLKGAGETQRLEPVQELTRGWHVKFNEYRGALVLSIANSDINRDLIALTSYIAYGVPIGDKMDVYVIDPSRIDVYEPTVENPFWKLYGTKDSRRRYQILP